MKRFDPMLDAQYSRIFVGAAWPTTREGIVVVVGEHRLERRLGRPLLVVLDEAADDRLWDLVARIAALSQFYHPERIFAAAEHIAAMQFASHWKLPIEPALLTAMEGPLAYAVPVVQRMFETHRIELPEGSRLKGEWQTVPAFDDLARLDIQQYPGVAALSYAVLALDASTYEPSQPRQERAEIGKVL